MAPAILIAAVALAAASPEHGERQVAAMLDDRPAMAGATQADLPLRRWAAAQFEGASAGAPVFWDPAPPKSGFDAEHTPPQPTRRASVRVSERFAHGPSRGQHKRYGDLWADLVFEFHNLANAASYAEIHTRVSAGDIGPAQWLEALTRGEHAALLATAEFYRQRWLPWTEQEPEAQGGRRWLQIFATDPDYGRWMTRYQRPDGYPYIPLAEYFQRVLQPHRFRYQVEDRHDEDTSTSLHWQPPRYQPITP